MAYCEDYPCCGHTPQDPCEAQWYDEADAFNPLVNPHCFCEHEFGICEVSDYDEAEEIDPADCTHEANWSYRGDVVECDDCWTQGVAVSWDADGWIDKIEWEV